MATNGMRHTWRSNCSSLCRQLLWRTLVGTWLCHLHQGGNLSVAFQNQTCLTRPGSEACEKVVSSWELETKSLFKGDLKWEGWKGGRSSGSISLYHWHQGCTGGDWRLHKACWMQNEVGFGSAERKMRQAALCLTDTTYTDRGLYLYLNIVVCRQGVIEPGLPLFSCHLS